MVEVADEAGDDGHEARKYSPPDESPEPPFARALIPVANEGDAIATARAALPHLAAADGRATVVYVVEKAGGAPDKASVEQRELLAEEAFEAFAELAAAADVPVETDVLYGTDVVETILDAAAGIDATSVVFVPRGGRSILDLLTGDVRDRLVTESDRPVVVLPAVETDGDRAGDTDDADAEPATNGGAVPDAAPDGSENVPDADESDASTEADESDVRRDPTGGDG